jgi:hypothetical protein
MDTTNNVLSTVLLLVMLAWAMLMLFAVVLFFRLFGKLKRALTFVFTVSLRPSFKYKKVK